jgi:hypothetical protein
MTNCATLTEWWPFLCRNSKHRPAFVGYRTMRLTMSNKRPLKSRNGLVRIACLGRTHHRRVFYVAPAIWMWLGPFLLAGGASRALATRLRAAPSPYALPVNARARDRPHRAVLKSHHRSFGMPPLVVPATAKASAPTSRIILDIVISRTVGRACAENQQERCARSHTQIATAVRALRSNKSGSLATLAAH